MSHGSYDVRFDASGLSSGIYLYTIRVNDFSASKKMILMK
ncbi:MAG: T9SS type A sorting domain-containing protein [Ignavibacterium sp.]|nr:T9SS type A sorting domain-containing protein [Ignavibacterium sp.]